MIPLQIRFRDKTDKLATLFEPTMSCRVVIVMPHQHKHQCRFFSVRIDIGVSGREIVVNRDQHEDVYVALRDGFETAKRQLTAYAHRLHGDTQSHPSEHLGGVARIFPDEGYGFIRRTDATGCTSNTDNLVNATLHPLLEGGRSSSSRTPRPKVCRSCA